MSKCRKTTSVQHIGNDQVVVTFHYGEWANDYADRYEHKYEVLFIKRTPVVVRRSRVGGDTEVFRLRSTNGTFLKKVSKQIKRYLKKDYGAAKLVDEEEINRMALLFNDRILTINEFSDGFQDVDSSELETLWVPEREEESDEILGGVYVYVVRKLELDIIDYGMHEGRWEKGKRWYASSGINDTSPLRLKKEQHNIECAQMYGEDGPWSIQYRMMPIHSREKYCLTLVNSCRPDLMEAESC